MTSHSQLPSHCMADQSLGLDSHEKNKGHYVNRDYSISGLRSPVCDPQEITESNEITPNQELESTSINRNIN